MIWTMPWILLYSFSYYQLLCYDELLPSLWSQQNFNDFKLFTLIGMRKFSNEIRNYFIDRKKDKKLLIWAFNYDLLNGTII